MSVKNPYLIQRCFIKDWKDAKIFSEAVRLDYMGSSEFEWGAIPKFIESFSKKKNLEIVKFDGNILDDGFFSTYPYQIYFICDKYQVEEYSTILRSLLSGEIRTKESVFKEDVNLWLDLNNEIIFSSNREILCHMKELCEGSFLVIEKNREAKAQGEKLLNKNQLRKKIQEKMKAEIFQILKDFFSFFTLVTQRFKLPLYTV